MCDYDCQCFEDEWPPYERLDKIACEVLGHTKVRGDKTVKGVAYSWVRCKRCGLLLSGEPAPFLIENELGRIAMRIPVLFDRDDAFFAELEKNK